MSSAFTPYFDRGPTTRVLCIIGLAFSWLFALSCIGVGAAGSQAFWSFNFRNPIYPELVVLGQNILITICNESLGYIHSTSLRWALQREGRLAFNSNLRLMSSSRTSGPNKWYSNAVVLCGIITTYASSSLTFIKSDIYTDYYPFQVSGAAFLILGCGMAAQASITTWALLSSGGFPTWSSNYMDTAAACLTTSPVLKRRPGRCLRGVHLAASSGASAYPQGRQASAYSTDKKIRQVIWLMWICVIISCVWGVATLEVTESESGQSLPRCAWSLTRMNCRTGTMVSWAGSASYAGQNLPAVVFTWVFFLISIIQGTLTLTLHCAELHVNCSRDETSWRKASSTTGVKRTSNAFVAMLSSWQSMTLFCFKPFIHWLYGLIFMVDLNAGLVFLPPQIFYLTAGAAVLAVFSSIITFWRYKGPQPATFGHLQSLVDLIDEWPEAKDRVYWGDKGDKAGVAHAGTSWMPLAAIRFNRLYA
jgi:hypothetical protein